MHSIWLIMVRNIRTYLTFFTYDFLWNDDATAPTIKEIIAGSGLTSGRFNTLVKAIYKDQIINPSDIKVKVSSIIYEFDLTYFDKYFQFIIDNLLAVPRVGEEIHIDHFRFVIGTSYFHVRNVSHYFIDTKQVVSISLLYGGYNKYLHIRKDEAYCKREISIEDYYTLDDYDLKEKLKITPRNW